MKKQLLPTVIDQPMLDRIYGFCYARTSDRYVADALCSDILLAVMKTARDDAGAELAQPDAFLWKIAYRVYADFCERRKTEQGRAGMSVSLSDEETSERIPAAGEDADDPVSAILAAEEREELRAQLREIYRQIAFLGAAYRSVTVAFYLDGLSTKEIARREGIAENTVRQRLFAAREKIRKEAKTMSNQKMIQNDETMGLRPMHWIVWGTGNPLTGRAAEVCGRQISRHVVWLCRKQARTAKEISELLRIPMAYAEEELDLQVRGEKGYGMLRRTDDGKYIANVLLFDREEITAAHSIYLRHMPALCEAVSAYAKEHMAEYLAFPFLNRVVDENLVLWQQVFHYDCKISNLVADALEKRCFADISGAKRPYMNFIYEDVPGMRSWGGGCDGITLEHLCGYEKVHISNMYNSTLEAHFRCDHTMTRGGHLITNDAPLLLSIRAVNGIALSSLSQNEKETAAKAMEEGYLLRDGEMLYTKYLVYPMADYEKDATFVINRDLGDTLAPVTDAIADELSDLFRRILPPHLLCEYRFANYLAAIPLADSLIEAMLENGMLRAPENGRGAEGMWMAVLK